MAIAWSPRERAFAFLLARAQPRAPPFVGRAVDVGIRPSAFVESQSSDALKLPVILSEYLGAQSIIISELGGSRISIEVNATQPITAGGTRSFDVPESGIHLFDSKTENAI